MGVESDWSNLSKRLISCYAKCVLEDNIKLDSKRQTRFRDQRDAQLANTITSLVHDMERYTNEANIEKALDAIDLGSIFEKLDQREKSAEGDQWAYEDHLVQETLAYFKNDFFKWVNKPKCTRCGDDGDNIEHIGMSGPPSNNPDEIGRIEKYRCKVCNIGVDFPRINNPAKLLETRRGRCGEWVNCFLLILQSVVGPNLQLRYIWNKEDHVWCEYYSNKQQRWIHLDPCENVFDEPSLYCENWGKSMSYVIGVGHNYIIDLSNKYITKNDKRIPKSSVVSSEAVINSFIKRLNARLMLIFWHNSIEPVSTDGDGYERLYDELILVQNKEILALQSRQDASKSANAALPQGRQTGSAEWTKARGENGE